MGNGATASRLPEVGRPALTEKYAPVLRALGALAVIPVLLSCGSDLRTATEPPTPIPTTVTVTPGNLSFDALGDQEQLSAAVRDQYGDAMPSEPVSWGSSNSSVVQVSSGGLATSRGNGTATIMGSAGGAAGTATAAVQQVARSLTIATPRYNLEPSDTLRIAAEASDANGHELASAHVDWTSSDESVATVSSSGLVTGIEQGVAVVAAALTSGLRDSVALSVAPQYTEVDPGHSAVDTTNEAGTGAVYTNSFGGRRIEVDVEDDRGDPLTGAVLEYSEVENRSLVYVDPPDTDLVGAIFYGHPDSIDAWLGAAAEGPPFASDGDFSGHSWRAALKEGGMAFHEYAELLDQFVWDFAAAESNECLTYEEAAALAKAHAGLPLQTATLFLSAAGAPLIEYVTKGFSLADRWADLDVSDIAWFFINGLDEYLGLPLDHTLTTRVRVTTDFIDPRDFGAKYRNAAMALRFDPDDDYCRGRIPSQLNEVTGTLTGSPGGTVTASVQVVSDWGNGVEGVPVAFDVASGSGQLSASSATSDEDGLASVEWTLPQTRGTYELTVSAYHEETPLAGSPLTLIANVANPTVEITTTSLPDGIVSTSYSASLHATGGTGTYTWTINSSSLPPGLGLSGNMISGMPTTAGTWSFRVTVESGGATDSRTLSIQVANPSLEITTTSLPDGSVGASYSASLQATGGSGSYSWSTSSGSLPPGLDLSGNTIGGTPTVAGSWDFQVTVGSGGDTDSRTLSIQVRDGGGEGEKILFTTLSGNQWDIHSINEDGSGEQAVIATSLSEGAPSLSPDRTTIVYTAAGSDARSSRVYTANRDGSNRVQLTTADYCYRPGFSPDGDRIAYSAEYVDAWDAIFVMNSDGCGYFRTTAKWL